MQFSFKTFGLSIKNFKHKYFIIKLIKCIDNGASNFGKLHVRQRIFATEKVDNLVIKIVYLVLVFSNVYLRIELIFFFIIVIMFKINFMLQSQI
jgi:hypothetical protein